MKYYYMEWGFVSSRARHNSMAYSDRLLAERKAKEIRSGYSCHLLDPVLMEFDTEDFDAFAIYWHGEDREGYEDFGIKRIYLTLDDAMKNATPHEWCEEYDDFIVPVKFGEEIDDVDRRIAIR